jgi:hypothetical protein
MFDLGLTHVALSVRNLEASIYRIPRQVCPHAGRAAVQPRGGRDPRGVVN